MVPWDNVQNSISNSATKALRSKEPEAIKELVLAILNGDQENYSLLSLLETSIQNLSPLDNETAFTLSLLFSDVEHQAELNDQLHALASDQGPPALALSSNGQVVGYNDSATSSLGNLLGKNILRLGVSQLDFTDFKDRIVRHQGPSILQFHVNKQKHTPLIFTGKYQSSHQLFFLRMIGLQWSESMDKALQDIFKLTKAEREVLVCLARGMQAEQISGQRQSTIGTVRQQIKSILQKLGVTSQIQAAALAASLGSQSHNEHQSASFVSDHNKLLGKSTKHTFNLLQQEQFVRDNRRVGWRRYGKKGGQPVLLMHSTYFGAGDHAPDRALAYKLGLDVITVERPGYGRTQPPSSTVSILDTHIKDCIYLLNELGWHEVWLKSHDFGLVPALTFANYYPKRVQGIFAVSPLPLFLPDSDLSAIPIQQRAFIWAAHYSFWMIKLLLRVGHVKARKLGPAQWMQMVFDGTPDELKVFQTDAGREVSESSYHFNLIQNSKGQVFDMQFGLANDWTELLREVKVPLAGLTGKRNTTFDVYAVRALKLINPNFDIKEVEMASLTLAITDAEACHYTFLDLMKVTGSTPV